MFRAIFLAALFTLAAAVPGLAADMGQPKAAAPLNWTGPYLGGQIGYGWSDPDYTYSGLSHHSFSADGIVGGVTAGYNFQSGPFVYGLEGDLSFSDIHGDSLATPGGAPCYIEGCSAKVPWFGTVRGRVGYAYDSFLPYVTGGLAFGKVEGSADLGACASATCGFDKTKAGWTVGGGLEWRVDQRWSVKAEYLYVDLGKPDFNASSVTANDIAFHTVRLGVNFHF